MKTPNQLCYEFCNSPTVLKWKQCNCGASTCEIVFPATMGHFFDQGSGFYLAEAKEIEAAFRSLAEQRMMKLHA